MVEAAPENVIRATRRTHFPERENIPQTIQWVEAHKKEFLQYVKAFDEIVKRCNAGEVPEQNINQREVRNSFKEPLPRISPLLQEGGAKEYMHLIRTIKDTNDLMERGEEIVRQRKAGNPEPKLTGIAQDYLNYHTSVEDDPEAVFAGSLFHIYEEYVARDPKFSGFKRDLIVNALCEALVDLHSELPEGEPQNPLYDPIVNKKRLNWVDGYKDFGDEFLTNHEFSLPEREGTL